MSLLTILAFVFAGQKKKVGVSSNNISAIVNSLFLDMTKEDYCLARAEHDKGLALMVV